MAPKDFDDSDGFEDWEKVDESEFSQTDLKNAMLIAHGDELRNINSYEYLKNIYKALDPKSKLLEAYDPDVSYGDKYTEFLITIERECELQRDNPNTQLDKIVRVIYENDNLALERTAAMTKGVLDAEKHTSSAVEKKVRERLQNSPPSSPTVNKLSPQQADSIGFKMGPMISAMAINQTKQGSFIGNVVRKRAKGGVDDFKPMTTTSQVSIRKYHYKNTGAYPMELRMGTQAQYQKGVARMNPIFERRLMAQREAAKLNRGLLSEDLPDQITHVYFNNLGRDDEGLSTKGKLERGFEYNLTKQLELADYNNPNLAVITLPADKGFLDKKLLTDNKKESCNDAFTKFLQVANGTSKIPIQDFFISDKVQKLLYGKDERGMVNDTEKNKQLTELLNTSFKKVLGVDNPSVSTKQFSQAQLQAVYFHFIKFELTDFILKTLQPDTFNTSCKDGIDRGGVSSAYYNLMKSLETDKPLDKDEFYRALHAAPTLVKGRAMNHHTKLIWNAIDNYLAGNQKLPDKKPIPKWLVEWRNKNVPEKMKATPLLDERRGVGVTVSDLAHASWLAYTNDPSDFTNYQQKHLDAYNTIPSNKTASGCVYAILESKETTNKKPIIIAFKGTDNRNDLVADTQIVRHGKAINYQKDADSVIANVIKKYPGRPIIVTGHSLGGSLANHAVAKIANDSTKNIDIRAVTFGAPGMDKETYDTIYRENNAPRFITFENTNDLVAGSAGTRPTDIAYRMSEAGHSLENYTVVNATDSKIRENSRLNALSKVVVSGDLETVHHNLMTQDLERLKEKNEDGPKQWFMGVVLNLDPEQKIVSPIKPYDLFIQAMKMDDRRYRDPASKKEIQVEQVDGKITNMEKIKDYLSSEISRMEKDDHKYLKFAVSKQGTLKLALFKSLKEKLEKKEEPAQQIDPDKLQTSLNAIQSMHRDQNYQVDSKNLWIQQALSAIYSSQDMFKTVMEHTRHRWFGPLLSGPKSANNIPQVETNNEKITNLDEIKKALATEIERMKSNDNNYTKSSGTQTLKLYLFELLNKKLKTPNISNEELKTPNISPIELQSTLNTIFRIERSEKLPFVNFIKMGLAEDKLKEKPANDNNFEFFWQHLSKSKNAPDNNAEQENPRSPRGHS